jgi:hypothetical protein
MLTPRCKLHFKDFEMSLGIADLRSLLPHEDIIPELLERLSKEIEKDKVIKHPIIVDRGSMVVLDGNHRTEAMKKLGYQYIPVCMVDYQSPLIQVKCWYRTIEGEDYNNLVNSFGDFRQIESDFGKTNEAVNSTNALAIVTKRGAMISNPYNDLVESYEALREVERKLRDSGFKIGYASEEEASKGVFEGSILAYVAMSPLTKKAIIDVARSGRRLPCKTSRHILPARPMGMDFPLGFLKNESLDEANHEFYLWMSKRRVEKIPSRSVFEGRMYEESIFLLHE